MPFPSDDDITGFFDEAAQIVRASAHDDCNEIFGAVTDDSVGDHVRVTVIATGFEREVAPRRPTRPTIDRWKVAPFPHYWRRAAHRRAPPVQPAGRAPR